MDAKPTVVIISQYALSQNIMLNVLIYKVIYVNYFSIKPERKGLPHMVVLDYCDLI